VPYSLLKKKNPYFRNLSLTAQERFVERMYVFMGDKYFIGREGLVITDEIRVLISASAIQLTFGLKEYTIPHLHTINVFPRVFYSKMFETSFKGLTTRTGVLSISWDDFQEGYATDNDKVNLGLHELAHALNIDLIEGSYDEHFTLYFEKWKLVAKSEFLKLKEGSLHFLRKYGSRNFHEFFAVCIEHFFEAPDDFKLTLPHLYGHTALMLNQDPGNIDNDYQIKSITEYFYQDTVMQETDGVALISEFSSEQYRDLTLKQKLRNYISKNGLSVAMSTTFVGLFLGIPLLIWFSSVTIIDIGTLLLMIFACGTAGLMQWRFVRNLVDMEYHHFAMYSFSGFAMCLLNFLLFLNLSFPVSARTETYDLDSFRHTISKGSIEVEMDDPALTRNLNTFLTENFIEVEDARQMTVKYNTGLLGFDSIKECTFH
jgi:Mlc titration factor MtfA (ptsG expression regulator)